MVQEREFDNTDRQNDISRQDDTDEQDGQEEQIMETPAPSPPSVPELASAPEPVSVPGTDILRPSRWSWIGSPSRPEAQESRDGISDLFEVGGEDDEEDIEDLTSVDIENDIIDADPDTGDLSDLTDVFEEDVMGMPGTGQPPSEKFLRQKRRASRFRRLGGTGVREIRL